MFCSQAARWNFGNSNPNNTAASRSSSMSRFGPQNRRAGTTTPRGSRRKIKKKLHAFSRTVGFLERSREEHPLQTSAWQQGGGPLFHAHDDAPWHLNGGACQGCLAAGWWSWDATTRTAARDGLERGPSLAPAEAMQVLGAGTGPFQKAGAAHARQWLVQRIAINQQGVDAETKDQDARWLLQVRNNDGRMCNYFVLGAAEAGALLAGQPQKGTDRSARPAADGGERWEYRAPP